MKDFKESIEEKIRKCNKNYNNCWNCEYRIKKLLEPNFCDENLYIKKISKKNFGKLINNLLERY